MVSHTSGKTDIDLYVVNQVRELRIEHNISQAILAVKLDVSDSFIGAIENPKHRAKYNLAHINKLARIFDCSPRDFLPQKPL